MTRLLTITVALVCLSMGAFMLPALSQAPEKAKSVPMSPASKETQEVVKLLRASMSTKGLRETIKLKNALEYIADQFAGKLVILVDRDGFFLNTEADAPDPYEEEVSLPPVPTSMAAETVLRILLTQVGRGDATFVIRNSWIEITTRRASHTSRSLHHPCVIASFERRALPEILQELSDKASVTINLDPNIGDKAATPITATFRNCSLEEALVTITEMAKLKYVVLERSIYVTTPEHAQAMEKEEATRRKAREVVKQKPAAGA